MKKILALIMSLVICSEGMINHAPTKPNIIKKITKGILYLTSPDTGKIIYVDLNNLDSINYIQTMGVPWELTYSKQNMNVYVSDFGIDEIYTLMTLENSSFKSIKLQAMSNPKGIEISSDDASLYILESMSGKFSVYSLNDEKITTETSLPPNPVNLAHLKKLNLIGITCPNVNQLVLLNTQDLIQSGTIMLENGPEKIIAYETDNTFFISSRNGTIVYEIDPVNKMIKKSIELYEMPTSLALHPKKKLLYVGSSKSDIITIVDTESGSIIRTIKLPIETQFPSDLEITKDGKWLIVTSESTNTISIIDLVKENVAVKLNVKATTHAAVIVEE